MKIFDTQVHYNLEPLFSGKIDDPRLERFKLSPDFGGWSAHWQQAQAHGVAKSVVVGTDFFSSSAATQIAATDPNLYATVGIHPGHVSLDEEDLQVDMDELAMIIGNKVVAIGETGLDYFHAADATDPKAIQQAQRRSFVKHIDLANRHQLPLVLHVRDKETPTTQLAGNAYWDTLELIEKNYHWQRPVVLHCVSGPVEYVQRMLKLGAYIGVAGNVTYPSADQIRTLVALAPAGRVLLETDAPFLPPQQNRGKLCEPWMISQTAEYLRDELKCDLDQIYQNSLQFFKIG